ncbi:MAG: primosome assembly protein PriA, partial [Actinomycetota bacterium]
MSEAVDEQLALVPTAVRAAARRRTPKPPPGPADVDPVAEVLVDVALAHLDRPFEYLVPEPMSLAAVAGARVRVRFAGQDLDGWVVARKPVADHTGRLAPLRRVVSPEPVLGPELLRVCRAVADHWAGALPDVVRLAVPPRHADAEKVPAEPALPAPPRPRVGPWADYPAGPAFLDRLHGGAAPRAAWAALPGSAGPDDGAWPQAVAVAVATTLAAGRGALVVVPDHRDAARLDAAIEQLVGPG